MSANETFDAYYAETAYTPDKRSAWEAEHPKRKKIIGSRLPWDRKAQDTGPEEEYDYSHIEISQSEEKRRSEKNLVGTDIFKGLKVRYDHQAIMPPNYTALANVFIITISFAKFFTYFLPIIAIGTTIILLLITIFSGEYRNFLDLTIGTIKIYTSLTFFSYFLWKALELLSKKRPDIAMGMRKGPLWEINRQTGLVTFYHKKRAWKQRLQAPFHEFDAFLQSSPDTQGSSTYSLILYHPEQRIKQKLDAQFPPTKMDGELRAAWRFMQRYMDVSQTLPDVPGLEIHRHKDPTTAAADKRKKRNPRYWRDMSEQSINKIQREKYLKNIRH